MKHVKTVLAAVPVIAVSAVWCIFLWQHLTLGLVRYMDVDELAYLHWAHNVFTGALPYRDFLLYVPPAFLYVLAPLFSFVSGSAIITASRFLAWVIFLFLCLTLGDLFTQMRADKKRMDTGHWWMAFLLPGCIVSFLPMPADKLLEVRPDTLATALLFAAMAFQLRAMRASGSRMHRMWIVSGLFFGASVYVLPKVVPYVVFAAVIYIFWWVRHNKTYASFRTMVMSVLVPSVLFVLWAVFFLQSRDAIGQMIYSLTRLPFEVNRIGAVFGMQPDLFFYPNPIYYGEPGWNIGLIVNHIAWLLGLAVGIYRLFTPWMSAEGTEKEKNLHVLGEVLVSGSMVVSIVMFVYGFPLRHTQYLIPVSGFVALFAADALYRRNRWIVAGAALLLVPVFFSVHTPKFFRTNMQDRAVIDTVQRSISPGAYVFDLTGGTVYFADPYYVSAVPFGQWEAYIERPLPDLPLALEKTHTQYVYEGELARMSALSLQDQAYIKAHFVPVKTLPGLWKRTQ